MYKYYLLLTKTSIKLTAPLLRLSAPIAFDFGMFLIYAVI